MKKKTLKIIILVSVLLIVIYNLLLSDINPMFKNEEFIFLTKELNEAKKENLDSIVADYNSLNLDFCDCETTTNNISPYRHGYSLTKLIYRLKIDREYSLEDCLKFELLHSDFLYGNKGVKEASKYYFSKDFRQLNRTERLTFIIMLENASYFNPFRRPKKIKTRIRMYEARINKNGR